MDALSTLASSIELALFVCPALAFLPITMLIKAKLNGVTSRKRYFAGIGSYGAAILIAIYAWVWFRSTLKVPGSTSGVFLFGFLPFTWAFSALGGVLALSAIKPTNQV